MGFLCVDDNIYLQGSWETALNVDSPPADTENESSGEKV
jgi:hypothetical protein